MSVPLGLQHRYLQASMVQHSTFVLPNTAPLRNRPTSGVGFQESQTYFSSSYVLASAKIQQCVEPRRIQHKKIRPRANRSHMECQSDLLMRSFKSRAAPLKIVPLSPMTVCGLPGLGMNRVIAIILASVSILFNTSRYAALVTKHMNKQHQYFTGLLITVTLS